jgi:hypothetical protein
MSPIMLTPLAPFLTNVIPLFEAILCLIMVLSKTRAIGMFIAFFVQYYFTIYLVFLDFFPRSHYISVGILCDLDSTLQIYINGFISLCTFYVYRAILDKRI